MTGVLLWSTSAAAHTVWLEAQPSGAYRVFFGGHAGKLEPYSADRLKTVDAYAVDGTPIKVVRSGAADDVWITPEQPAAVIGMHYDNGIYAGGPGVRSVNLPMDQVPGADRATHAVKHHKTIVQWVEVVTQPIGQPFEITPLSAQTPKAGQPMPLRITLDGRPAAGIRIGRGEAGADGITDDRGVVSFVPAPGFNRVWAGKRIPVHGNPQYTELSYEYALGFDAK